MKTVKQLGIWMDHSNAFVMELLNDTIIENSINSEFTQEVKEAGQRKGEVIMHNKEQQKQASYYKELSDIIRNYQEVLLFGPTEAKNELFNLIKADHLFDNIKVEVRSSDNLAKKQMHDFVRDYFKK